MDHIVDQLVDLERRQRRERARLVARSPKPIARIVADVVRIRGYARVQSQRALQRAWHEAVGAVGATPTAASLSRPGRVRRGMLEVWVANPTVNQELMFCKQAILEQLQKLVPDQRLRDIRIRVGGV